MRDTNQNLLSRSLTGAAAAALVAILLAAVPAAAEPSWAESVRAVHARFTGRAGTFAQFGDSITVTQAFWTPLLQARRHAPPEMERAFRKVQAYLRPECWREWKGPEYGSQGGMTVRWAFDNVDAWLKKLNPEVALIMFGSNDLHSLELPEYQEKLRAVIRKCLANGTVVMLSTIPPRHGFAPKAADFAQAGRALAEELHLPLTDLHAEILRRRPKDWDGSLDQFHTYEGYEVPTLLSRDGVHPSYPQRYQNDYSEEARSRSGYSLRNYMVLLRYAEVVEALGRSGKEGEKGRRGEGESRQPRGGLLSGSPSPLLPFSPSFGERLIAPPLPSPRGEVLRAAGVDALFEAAARVKPGGTIMVADGHYMMPRRLEIKTDNVTLRGASGKREAVVLDGGGTLGELLAITACSGVTIADLTVQNVRWNGIKINSETNVQRLTIHNCVLHNIWQRAVKGVKVPAGVPARLEGGGLSPSERGDRERIRPKGCRIEYCLFTNDRPKQFSDDPADTAENFGGNYVGGIDVMYVRGWTISDNRFVGIQGRTRAARGAIFIWHESEDCVVERNVIVDCDSGICLGNSSKPEDVAFHCANFIVRNNFVTRAPENGILADYTRGCRILHNTVHDPQNRLGRLIRLVHDNDGLLVANNLLSGPPLRNESPSKIDLRGNLEKDMTAAFVAPEEGDLRLTARAVDAIDHGVPLPAVTEDIDRRPRGRKPDIGAHEFRR
jgi:hypothetical protein